MDELKITIIEQLEQFQRLVLRSTFSILKGQNQVSYPRRSQGRLLALLKLKPEIGQRELSFLLGMSRQSSAELLQKLENQGYITKEQAPDDKRSVIVKLTETGRQAAEEPTDYSSIASESLDCLSEEELQIFSKNLARIINQFAKKLPAVNRRG